MLFSPLSEFFHLARKTLRDEAGLDRVPSVAMNTAYPFGVWVAVLADENGARSGAIDVAAVVMFHGS